MTLTQGRTKPARANWAPAPPPALRDEQTVCVFVIAYGLAYSRIVALDHILKKAPFSKEY